MVNIRGTGFSIRRVIQVFLGETDDLLSLHHQFSAQMALQQLFQDELTTGSFDSSNSLTPDTSAKFNQYFLAEVAVSQTFHSSLTQSLLPPIQQRISHQTEPSNPFLGDRWQYHGYIHDPRAWNILCHIKKKSHDIPWHDHWIMLYDMIFHYILHDLHDFKLYKIYT